MDRKRRRTGAHTNAVSHTDGDSASDSSRTAPSDTRASPDILNSVAGSRMEITATGAVLNHVHTVLLNRLASGSRLVGNRFVTF